MTELNRYQSADGKADYNLGNPVGNGMAVDSIQSCLRVHDQNKDWLVTQPHLQASGKSQASSPRIGYRVLQFNQQVDVTAALITVGTGPEQPNLRVDPEYGLGCVSNDVLGFRR